MVWESDTLSGNFTGKRFIRTNIQVNGLVLAKPGEYVFRLELGTGARRKEVGQVSVDVEIAQE
jgi:hypothetical protein